MITKETTIIVRLSLLLFRWRRGLFRGVHWITSWQNNKTQLLDFQMNAWNAPDIEGCIGDKRVALFWLPSDSWRSIHHELAGLCDLRHFERDGHFGEGWWLSSDGLKPFWTLFVCSVDDSMKKFPGFWALIIWAKYRTHWTASDKMTCLFPFFAIYTVTDTYSTLLGVLNVLSRHHSWSALLSLSPINHLSLLAAHLFQPRMLQVQVAQVHWPLYVQLSGEGRSTVGRK